MVKEHKWHLVGPWYRWGSEEDPHRDRLSRPILQKYADSDLVSAFIENPQRSLRFLAEDRTETNRRKVYLDTHNRFYLVTSALHCDGPRFPKVARDKICEAGFVVRRRRTDVPDEIRVETEKLLQKIAYQRARLKQMNAKRQRHESKVGASVVTQAIGEALIKSNGNAVSKYTAKLAETRQELTDLLASFGVTSAAQKWRQIRPGLGTWENIDDLNEESPESIDEEIHPLYPAIPETDDEDHSSGHKTIWYGLLPVASAATDTAGNPRFDDRSVYEVRCFVRRHKPHCPRKNTRNDCNGELVWSRPTEAYQLASHFDLVGTSNRLTTIQAPNLDALRDYVEGPNFKTGQGVGVAIATPGGDSQLPIAIDEDGNPAAGDPSSLPSICFFAIPLITIVALFVLRLFLPIVVFLFGLWFLLSLKLCILPTMSVDLSAELGAGLEADLAANVSLDAQLKSDLYAALPSLRKDLHYTLKALIDGGGQDAEDAYRSLARMAIDQSMDFSGSGIAPESIAELAEQSALPDVAAIQKSTLPNPIDRLTFYEEKTLAEVFA